MRFVCHLIVLLVLVLVNSCKNDLKIIAPYKEIPQVYAVLSAQSEMQMIRINKTFLGQGNANQMAQVPDSVNYQPGDLTVKLERYMGNVKVAAGTNAAGQIMEVVFRDSVIQADPGAFSTVQRVYVTNDKLFTTGVYRLIITNNHTGNQFVAKAPALDSIPLSFLPPMAPPYYGDPALLNPWEPPSSYVNYSAVNSPYPYVVRTKEVKGAFLHDLTIRIHYYDSLNTGRVNQYLDYEFQPKQLKDQQPLSANLYFTFTFGARGMFQELGNMLKQRGNYFGLLGRKAYRVDFICYAVTEDYYEYLQYASPSLTFAQEKILYSNFENRAALGIFTFRSRCHVMKAMDVQFIDQFAVNPNTCSYLFWESDFDRPGCP